MIYKIIICSFIFFLVTSTITISKESETPTLFNDSNLSSVASVINNHNPIEIKKTIKFSEPTIVEHKNYTSVELQEADTYLKIPGKPILPIITKTFTFPIGTIFSNISCKPLDIHEIVINKEIPYAMGSPSFSKTNIHTKTDSDISVYKNDAFYPITCTKNTFGIGFQNKEHVTFLTIQLYPVQYNPVKHTIRYINNIEINIQYNPSTYPVNFPDEYDLVIIAPSKFSSDLQPLVKHKENMNVKTNIVTTEEIYRDYKGRDQQEKIKYFIKHALEEWGVSYVLLIGGMNGQNVFSWHVPIRYSYLCNGGENRYISDLYYSDIYKYDNETGLTFDDWDSNGNNIFAEWYAFISSEKPYTRVIVDILDMYPDVYLGRIPCRYKYEVKYIVDRIINYESTTYGKEWFNKMVVLGGDNANESLYFSNATDYYEGELMTSHALSFMDGFDQIRLWPEGGDVELSPQNAETILSEGEGFVYFAGHGDPSAWLTHPHGDESTWIKFTQDNIKNLKNGEKQPILLVSGCHNCQFDTGLLRLFTDGVYGLTESLYLPKCWGWQFTSQKNGGSIASIGHTGTSYYGTLDGNYFENQSPDGIPDCIQYFDGWLEPHFFELYNREGIDILGETHGQALTDYLNQFPIDWNTKLGEREKTATFYDCKTVQEWVLLGDPSLKIGGYPQ